MTVGDWAAVVALFVTLFGALVTGFAALSRRISVLDQRVSQWLDAHAAGVALPPPRKGSPDA